MANRRPSKKALNKAAITIGKAFAQIAKQLDRLHIRKADITTEIHHLTDSAGKMLTKMRDGAEHEVAVFTASVKRGRKAGFKMSSAARRKMSIAAKKRHAAKKTPVEKPGK